MAPATDSPDAALPHGERSRPDSTILVFRAGGSKLGLEADCVAEVARATLSTPLPLAPRHVVGFCELRGEALVLVDLAAHLGLKEGPALRDGLAVVVSIRGDRFALLVDEVEGVVEAEGQLAPLPARTGDQAASCCRGILKREGESVLVLEAGALLAPPDGRSLRTAAGPQALGGERSSDATEDEKS